MTRKKAITVEEQRDFLRRARAAAAAHPYPEFAACEAALESRWGQSLLARTANNLFGQKQGRKFPLPYPTVDLTTGEDVDGLGDAPWEKRRSLFVKFPDWATSFRERMALLRRRPSIYGEALKAKTGDEFVRQVSGYLDSDRVYHGRWATDALRAEKVLAIYAQHAAFLKKLDGAVPASPELWGEA